MFNQTVMRPSTCFGVMLGTLVVFITVARGDDPVQHAQQRSIPSDNHFLADYGNVKPGDVLVLDVTADPGCTILSGSAAGGTWRGGPTHFTAVIPDSFAGIHEGSFEGTYSCGQGGVGGPKPWDGKAIAYVFKVNLTAHRPQHEDAGDHYAPFTKTPVPEEQEEDDKLGPGIRINGDSDAGNENDLIEVLMERNPNPPPQPPAPDTDEIFYVLRRGSTKIRVYRSRDATNEIVFNLDNNTAIRLAPNDPSTIWVEWDDDNHGTATLTLEAFKGKIVDQATQGHGTVLTSDGLLFHTFKSVIVAFGGLGATPPDAGAGPFVIAIQLYNKGYDAHMYNENNRDEAEDEIRGANADRGVSQLALAGHSKGGGSVRDIAKRLNDNAPENPLSLKYSTYIDAIRIDLLFFSAEDRYPANSLYHVNFYQRMDPGVKGVATSVGGTGTNLRLGTCQNDITNGLGAHTSIDNSSTVVTGIISGIQTDTVDPANSDFNNTCNGPKISIEGISSKVNR